MELRHCNLYQPRGIAIATGLSTHDSGKVLVLLFTSLFAIPLAC